MDVWIVNKRSWNDLDAHPDLNFDEFPCISSFAIQFLNKRAESHKEHFGEDHITILFFI